MNTSELVTDIFSALVRAQGAITNAKTTAENPFFKSRYADLAEIINTAKKPLADNDLAIIQSPSTSEGKVIITGRIIHKSGQWIEDSITFDMSKKDPQSIGTLITYGRRYQLAAFVGLAQEDDDGTSASGNTGENNGNAPKNLPPPPPPKSENTKELAELTTALTDYINAKMFEFPDKVQEVIDAKDIPHMRAALAVAKKNEAKAKEGK